MLTKLSNLYVSTQQMGLQLVGTYARNKKTEFANSLQARHNTLIIKGNAHFTESEQTRPSLFLFLVCRTLFYRGVNGCC